ncbi:MAG: MmgE/PrpD family protein [Acidimicrobiales bacterium]
MDKITETVADFVLSTDYDSLSPEVIAVIVRHHLDGVGCAAGAFDSEPARIVRSVAQGVTGPLNASVYGLSDRVLVDSATFANSSMNRYLDFNDTIPAHPNDMVPALFSIAEATGASGEDLILSIYIGYEVQAAFFKGSPGLRIRGWDQGSFLGLGAVAGVSKLLGLTKEEIGNAISLTVIPNIPLRVVRTGVMTHWKGCATAYAARSAVFAAQLAQNGLQGPGRPFDGVDGFFSQVSGTAFDVEPGVPVDGLSAIERSAFKYYPSEFNSQVPLGIVLELRKEIDVDDIETLSVATHHVGWHEIGGGQGDVAEKWDPRTRETADHSLPYVLAVALTDGKIAIESFEMERVLDPKLRPLMDKISVVEDKEMSRQRDEGLWAAEVTIQMKDGRVIKKREDQPKGVIENPMSDEELLEKFDAMVPRVLGPAEHALLRERLLGLAQVKDLEEIASLFRQFTIRAKESAGA